MRFVLDGSVQASGQDVRVTAQLVDSKTGAQLWNETFKGDLSNLFALQDQVTALVGNSIGERMVIVAARESETRRSAPQVVDLMLRARALSLPAAVDRELSRRERLYREALSQEPNNVFAMVSLASTLAVHATWLDSSDPARDKQITDARDLALRVKAIDPGLRGIELPLYDLRHGAQRLRRCAAQRRGGACQAAEESSRLRQLRASSTGKWANRNVPYRCSSRPCRCTPREGNHFCQPRPAYLQLGDNDAAIEWLLKTVDLNTEIVGHVLGARHGVLQQGRHAEARHAMWPSTRSAPPRKASRGSKATLRHRRVRRPS